MDILIRVIASMLLSVLALNGYAHSSHPAPEIRAIRFDGVDMSDDERINVFYTILFDSPLRTGEKMYCFITPVDIENKPFPDGNNSFLTSGGLYEVTREDCESMTIDIPVSYIKRISGTDEYYIKVSLISETDDELLLEESYAFSYTDLKKEANALAMQTAYDFLDSFFGGDDSEESGIFKQKKKKQCGHCAGSGACQICGGWGSSCDRCGSTRKCQECNGFGYVYID